MPQFDISTFSSQIFWLSILFIIQYFIAAKILVPGFKVIYSSRTKYIGNNLTKAEKLANEADALKLEYETQMKTSKDNATKKFDKVSNELQQNYDESLVALEQDSLDNFKQYEVEIERTKHKLADQLNDAIASSAKIIIQKISDQKVINKKDLMKYMN